jgi:tetratricopeptide (TPR) repeat protein
VLILLRFWGIFWVDASSSETAERSFFEVARTCGVKEDLQQVKTYLSNVEDPWLLIIDNADDPRMDVSKYIPAGNRGVVLVTTRNRECKSLSMVSSEFGKMERDEAITLLLRSIAVDDVLDETSRALATPIVKLLGYLALAIVQAGAVIRRKLCSLEGYCDLYSRHRKQLLGIRQVQGSEGYDYTIYTTWEVSLDMIRKMSDETPENLTMSRETARDAIEVLECLSFFHFENVSEEIFRGAWEGTRDGWHSEWILSQQLRVLRRVDAQEWDPHPIREAVTLLSSFSLINIDGVMSSVSMHPLVHTWMRDRLQVEERKKRWLVSASTLAICISWRSETPDRQLRRILLPHVDFCCSSNEGLLQDGDGREELANIFSDFSLVYSECGRYQEARVLREKVLETQRRTLGEEHPCTLRTMGNLATSYRKLGQIQKAAELGEEVLEASRGTLGGEHPDTLTTMGNLAISYRNLGQVHRAIALGEEALGASKKILGDEHPNTLATMNNLAVSYGALGQTQEAVAIGKKVLETRKKMLGDEHPDTLTTMDNIALGYRKLGQVHEAAMLGERILEVRERTLGSEHPDTLTTMSNLAVSYEELGQIEKAVSLGEKVLEARKGPLGDEHPDTLTTMNNLAISYAKLGRIKEAVLLEEEVLEARRRLLGDEHPNTLITMNNLAIRFKKLGEVDEAVALEEKVLEASKRTLGDEHPDTLTTMSNLATSYRKLGRIHEAIALGEKVVEARERTLGDQHPSTLTSMNNLAVSYSSIGHQQEALGWLQKVAEASKRVLDERHPNTISANRNLAECRRLLFQSEYRSQSETDFSTSSRRASWRPQSWLRSRRRSTGL